MDSLASKQNKKALRKKYKKVIKSATLQSVTIPTGLNGLKYCIQNIVQ